VVEQVTTVKVTAKRALEDKRKAREDELNEKKKKPRADSGALVESFTADDSATKKNMTAAQLKIILLGFGIIIPPGTNKAGLVKLIIESGLAGNDFAAP